MLKKWKEERYAKQNRRISRPCPAHSQRLDPVLGKLDGLSDHRIPAVQVPFADQLMIYAQRPDATACAEFDILAQPDEPLCQAWL